MKIKKSELANLREGWPIIVEGKLRLKNYLVSFRGDAELAECIKTFSKDTKTYSILKLSNSSSVNNNMETQDLKTFIALNHSSTDMELAIKAFGEFGHVHTPETITKTIEEYRKQNQGYYQLSEKEAKERCEMVFLETKQGFHIGLDASYLDQVGDFSLELPTEEKISTVFIQ